MTRVIQTREDGSSFKGDGKKVIGLRQKRTWSGRKGLQPGRKAVLLEGLLSHKSTWQRLRGLHCAGLWSLHTLALLWASNLPSLRWSQHSLPFLHSASLWGVKRTGDLATALYRWELWRGTSLGKEPKEKEILCWTLSMTFPEEDWGSIPTSLPCTAASWHQWHLELPASQTPRPRFGSWDRSQRWQQNSPFWGAQGIKEAHGKTRWLYLLQLSDYKACKQIKRRVLESARDGDKKTSPQGCSRQPSRKLVFHYSQVCLYILHYLVTCWIGFLTETHLFHLEGSPHSPGSHRDQQLTFPM